VEQDFLLRHKPRGLSANQNTNTTSSVLWYITKFSCSIEIVRL